MDTTIASAEGVRLIGHTDLNGHGDGMHVNVQDGFAFVGHMGRSRVGTSIVDVSDPARPTIAKQIMTPPGTHSHKVQVVDDLLLVNYERNDFLESNPPRWEAGVKVFDISAPTKPKEIGFFQTPGRGVHRITFWEEPYAFLSATDDGFTDQFFMALDMSQPDKPVEAGRWWVPGMNVAAGEKPSWPDEFRFAHHHALIRGNFAYCGWWDGGFVVLDISDLQRPKLANHIRLEGELSRCTHTALPIPGRDVLLVTNEGIEKVPLAARKVRLYDISTPESPRFLSEFPVPTGEFPSEGSTWFGPHNVHEPRPGSYVNPNLVFLTYFSGGLRIIDIEDSERPREIGHFIPEVPLGQPAIQLNDVYVHNDGLVYTTDRIGGGLYILELGS